MRFDAFTRFVVSLVIDAKFQEFDTLFQTFKMKQTSFSDVMINYDEFCKIIAKVYPNKNQRWMEISYREYMSGVLTDKTPLGQAVLKLVRVIYNEPRVHANYIYVPNQAQSKEQGEVKRNISKGKLQMRQHSIMQSKFSNEQEQKTSQPKAKRSEVNTELIQ